MLLLAALIVLVLAPAPARASPTLLVIGDSLALDAEPYMRASLPGWAVRHRVHGGVRLKTGMRWIAEERRPPPILAFSLFTNDAPQGAARLERAVIETLSRRPGCHVWATAYMRRPGGNPFAAANRRLRSLELRHPERIVLVDWAAAAVLAPALLDWDGVHTTELGAWARAHLFAQAAHRCHRRLLRTAAEDPAQRPVGVDRVERSRPSRSRASP